MKRTTPLLHKDLLTKIEKYISLFIYYILPIIIVIALISAIFATNNIMFSREPKLANLGRKLLCIVLFIKPITFLWKKYLNAEKISIENFVLIIKQLPQNIKKKSKKIDNNTIPKYVLPFLRDSIYSISLHLMKFRKELGIVCFWLLLAHWIFWQIFRIRQDFSMFFHMGNSSVLYWVISFIALLIGAITSNDYIMKKCKKNRKNIQMTSYIAFFFGAIHIGKTFILILYFTLKYFERRDTGQLIIRKKRISNQRNKITNNPWIKKRQNNLKNNKKINNIIDKICKK